MAQKRLQALFDAISQTASEAALRSEFIDTIGGYFQSRRWGIYFYSPLGQLTAADTYGISNVDAFLERYQNVGKAVDPIFKHVSAYHTPAHEGWFYTPAHEGWFYTPEEWERSPLYTRCCASMDHAHLMTGPIVGGGQMIGAVHFSRTLGTPAYTAQNIAELGAVCSHLSAQLASFKPRLATTNAAIKQMLTPREYQIAVLVAEGLTNIAIGQQLWISEHTVKKSLKRIFRKLDVHNRAAMTHRLLS